MMYAGAIKLDPDTYGSATAQLHENPYMLAAVVKGDRARLNQADVGLVQAYATMALAYETRESRFVLDQRLGDIETLIRDGKGW